MVSDPLAGHQNLFVEHAGLEGGLGKNKFVLELRGPVEGDAVGDNNDNTNEENKFDSQAHFVPLHMFHTSWVVLLFAVHKIFLVMTWFFF
jgi:hypothetical protein